MTSVLMPARSRWSSARRSARSARAARARRRPTCSAVRKRSPEIALTAWAEAPISSSPRSKHASTTASPSRPCVVSMRALYMSVLRYRRHAAVRDDGSTTRLGVSLYRVVSVHAIARDAIGGLLRVRDGPLPGHGGVQDRRLLPLHPLPAPRGHALDHERDGRRDRLRAARGRRLAAHLAAVDGLPSRSARSAAGTSSPAIRASGGVVGVRFGALHGDPGIQPQLAPVAVVGAGLGADPRRRRCRVRRRSARSTDRSAAPLARAARGVRARARLVADVGADPARDAVAMLAAARSAGIDFLEVARYNDETGRAPLRRLLRSRVRRDLPRVGLAARRGR